MLSFDVSYLSERSVRYPLATNNGKHHLTTNVNKHTIRCCCGVILIKEREFIVPKMPSSIFASGKFITQSTNIHKSKSFFFILRVHLKTLNSFVKVPKFNADLASDDEDSDEVVSEEFVWQQKRLSARELEQFKHLENCKTDEQKRYHQTIVDGGQTVSRIFSYVMDDQFTPPEDEPTECGDNDIIANVENFGDWHGSAAIQRGKCGWRA